MNTEQLKEFIYQAHQDLCAVEAGVSENADYAIDKELDRIAKELQIKIGLAYQAGQNHLAAQIKSLLQIPIEK